MADVVFAAIAINIASEMLVKTLICGVHIVQNANCYSTQGQECMSRLRTEVSTLQAINAAFKSDRVQQRIRDEDSLSYLEVTEILNSLFRDFIGRQCLSADIKAKLLVDSSIDGTLKKLEEEDFPKKASEAQREQSFKFIRRVKEEAAWTFFKKDKSERLVGSIEFWVTKLDRLASWTFPGMFGRSKNKEQAIKEVIEYVNDSRLLPATNFKAQIMAARLQGTPAIPDTTPPKLESKQVKPIERMPPAVSNQSPADPKVKSSFIYRTDIGGAEDRRQWANFSDKNGKKCKAIVEWKDLPGTEWSTLPDKAFTDEIDALVRTLRAAAAKPETFRVLHCFGWYKEPHRFGLVYRLPPGTEHRQCQTLGNILSNPVCKAQLESNLGNRLALAKALAWTMLELHTVGWLHKSFHPDNILLFGERGPDGSVVEFDWSSPYVVGFYSSRSSAAVSGKLNMSAEWRDRIYTHPDRQKVTRPRYQKVHDIYSLGVVLLELGSLDYFATEHNKLEHVDKSAEKLQEVFLERTEGTLKKILGETFCDVAAFCLNGETIPVDDEKKDYDLTCEFRSQVCENLEQIKI